MSYCEYIKTTTGWAIDLNKTYHDEKYGFPKKITLTTTLSVVMIDEK